MFQDCLLYSILETIYNQLFRQPPFAPEKQTLSYRKATWNIFDNEIDTCKKQECNFHFFSTQIDLSHMESLIDDATCAIVLNNPSNPCGSVFDDSHLREILQIAEKHCIPIIADEVSILLSILLSNILGQCFLTFFGFPRQGYFYLLLYPQII